MESAHEIYQNCRTVKDILTLIEEKENEDLFLDFKEVPDLSKGNDNLRKILAKSLSGFANSSGGVLIFGIGEGPKHKSLVRVPINDVKDFERRVIEHISRVTSYRVPNVVTKTILEDETSGYLLVLIPKSDLVPHQSVLDKKYYRRTGESFVPMEHYEIENMFGRSPKPVLVPDITVIPSIGGPNSDNFTFVFGLRNIGRLAATFPFLSIEFKNPAYSISKGIDGNGNFGLPKQVGSRGTSFGGDGNYIVYPEQFLRVTKSNTISFQQNGQDKYSQYSPLEVLFKVASRETRIEEISVKVDIDIFTKMKELGKSYLEITELNSPE